MEILKEHTVGLCPTCFEKVDTKVFAEGGNVFLLKKCPKHGESRGLEEIDVDFYKKIIQSKRQEDPYPYPNRCLMINVTHGCNLRCHLCYLPERDTRMDLPLEEIKEAIRDYKGALITLSGGEATTREELPEMIEYARGQQKIPILVTNGVKLKNYDYVMKLRQAGLVFINFSFNGLKEEAFTGIENARLLETKREALSNIRKVGGFYVQISFTMARGVNDDQFGKIFEYCLENSDFVYHLRARVAADVGKSMGGKSYFLSDYISLLSQVTGIPRDIYVDYWVNHNVFPSPYLFTNDFYDFLTDPEVSSRLMALNGFDSEMAYLSKYVGEKNASRIIGRKKSGKPFLYDCNFYIALFSWPEKETIDYEEIKCLHLDILTRDKKVLNFWDGVIRNQKYNFL